MNNLVFVFLDKKTPSKKYTLRKARLVHVLESEATKEFLEARWNGTTNRSWSDYKGRCRLRHEWGIYLRSRLDWDWDTASCLERLFELPEEVVLQIAPIATVYLDAADADTWKISTEASLPHQMRVAYKSATGETEYMTFVRSPSTGGVASVDEFAKVRDEASAVSSELRDGTGKIADKNSDSALKLETDSECIVKQVIEKQEKVAPITEEPSYGAVEESRKEPKIVGQEVSDGPQAQVKELGVKDNGFGEGSVGEDGLEEMMKNPEVIMEQHTDQISILSLD